MLIPVRCFTCNAMVRFGEYESLTESHTPKEAFDAMKVQRYCCRRMLLCNPRGLTDIIAANTMDDIKFDDANTELLMHMPNVRRVGCE